MNAYLVLEEVKPFLSDHPAGFVALAEVASCEKLAEYLRLEDLDDVQLTTSLDLKSFQLCELPGLVVDDVTLFQQFSCRAAASYIHLIGVSSHLLLSRRG